ncbi:MAG: DotU family type IV/VI secretion system protein [Holosporaceae bacterium]|jgi:type VI secretion system protein ImpK|nr:DotU family type IV/VI secretion system protein [Holosporaceae bacterium]
MTPSSLDEMFGIFCVTVFDHQKAVAKNDAEADPKVLHKSISSLLKIALENEESLCFGQDFREVVYLMAALADEIFLNMEWSGKEYWEENMLEYRYFGSQMAGDEVFNKINELLVTDGASTPKAEIYLKALALGFKGKYRDAEDEEAGIDAHRNHLFDFIQKNDKSLFIVGGRFFQKEYGYTIPTIHRKLLPDNSIVNYVCWFFIFMFLTVSSVVWVFETKDLRRLLAEISNIATRE